MRATTDTKKNIVLTKRDLILLHDIQRLRTLTSRQIKRLYFNDSSTGANRISKLKRAGLIKPNKVIRNGHKADTCYYITAAGMRAIGGKSDRAKKNYDHIFRHKDEKSSLKLQDYYIMRSEIYAALSPEWYWEDSREVKAQHTLNWNTYIAGALHSGENVYSVYLLSQNPEDQTLKKTQDEIFYNFAANRFSRTIILCENEETVDKIIAGYRPGPIFVLPYELGLKMLAVNEPPYSILARIYGEHPTYKPTRRYALYDTMLNGEYCLVNQLLYNNLETISAMKYYTREIYAQERLKLIVLAEKTRLSYYTQMFDQYNYPHFIWHTVDIEQAYQEKERLSR